jgi:hypothetical protein
VHKQVVDAKKNLGRLTGGIEFLADLPILCGIPPVQILYIVE